MITYLNTATEIAESGADIAIIPVGSVEQHSSHLPIGMDCLYAEARAKAIAERVNGILFPVLPVSTCYEHKGRFTSLWMRPITFYQMIQDIALSLRSQGIHKIAFIPGHGGIFIASPAIRELNAMYDDLLVLWVVPEADPNRKRIAEYDGKDIHAGEVETSIMLYLHEDLVNKEEMMKNDCREDVPQSYLNYMPLHAFSKTGVWGAPSLATKEKGEIFFKRNIDASVKYINDAFERGYKDAW